MKLSDPRGLPLTDDRLARGQLRHEADQAEWEDAHGEGELGAVLWRLRQAKENDERR